MAKKKSFEDILGADFRWPHTGDKVFIASDDPFANAAITSDEFTRRSIMPDGYKKAGDLLVDACEADRFARDYLVFPVIFNYRQFLELSLKYQIATYGPSVGIEPIWNTHRLEKLWAAFLDVLESYGTADPDHADDAVEETVLEFAKIDPGSDSYRYPVDNKGNPLPVTYKDLHLPTLKDNMEAVANYFEGCDGYLDHLRGAE